MDILKNIDLLAVGLTVATIGILGFVVFLNDRKSVTNRSFFYFSFFTIAYSSANYLYSSGIYQGNLDLILSLARLTIFFAIWHAFSIFQLFYVFPGATKEFSKIYKFCLFPGVVLVSVLNMTPLVFAGIDFASSGTGVIKTIVGKGIILFVLLAVFLVIGALYLLVKKTIGATTASKNRFKLVLTGAIITFFLLLTFNLILPAVFLYVRFVPFAPVFFLPFIIFTSYAILKEGLFTVKVIATELLVFALWILILIRALLSTQWSDIILNGGLFVILVIVGVFLIRSVFREVNQREKIEVLMKELSKSNDKLWVANEKLQELDKMKTEFVSLATHQLRSPLTAIKGYASMLLEGSFGSMEEKARGAVDVVFQSSQKLVQVIEDFLNITRIELGTMKYEQIEFDFKEVVENVSKELKVNVEKKGLQFSLEIDPVGDYRVMGDSGKLSQVVGNLIDNAIKYTKEGQIKVLLKKNPSTALGASLRLEISDSGVGIPAEVMPKLFLKFSRATDAGKTNIAGTGLGLYVAKEIIDAHHGKIWAESEGVGQGSRFIVELG